MAASVVLLIMIVGLRHQVGGDWLNYEVMFWDHGYMRLGTLINPSTYDPGYTFLSWLAHKAGFGIWFVNLICASIFAAGLTRFALAQPNPWLVFVVSMPYLVIVVAMGYTRQAAAIGLLLVSLSNFSSARPLRVILWILAASAFHKSALIMLPLVALSFARGRLGALVIIALAAPIAPSVLASNVEVLTLHYLHGEMQSAGALPRIIMNAGPAVLFLLFRKHFSFSEEENGLWTRLACAALICLPLLLFLPSTIVDRFALYLIPLQLVVLARMPSALGGPSARPGLFVGIIVYSAAVQLVWLTIGTHASYWVPYGFYPTSERF